ncbi:sigma-E processing peptidase SpoIIGA [Aquibacillus sp. 3ASR75-11]|uniref:Sporulation sigma-E factor-processing peptidase n=1 Tax=Terrihalobacillus insolitus TaxID=2950438 RepID=A0A9X4AMN6_9BACI|nr:sigma-E processing peptidase SpoIIGA [Terrihalobacillus insolitus]MDC3412841.1 sigma-E processing peptidase SpoIIGA [Terrihalobacillus insolitus]MDC3423683.1 sigma-E processing peptidase SpoIIGA [Terrihalobacillus insolitus]
MEIYLDAVWVLNLLLDFMILLLTQWITKDNTKRLRVAFGAFVASIIVPLTIYFPDSFLTSPLGKGLYSFIIIWCAFGFKNTRQYIKRILSFYFITFTLGGGLIASHFLLGQQFNTTGNAMLTFKTGYGDQISWIFVAIGFPIIWWFTKSRMDRQEGEKIHYDQLCEVTIQMKGKRFSTTGYIDSGNQLVDPLSQRPVIICDQSFLANWFSKTEWSLLEGAQETLDFEAVPEGWQGKMHIVPYQGVDGNRTFMIAIKPESLLLHYNNTELSTNKLLIGLQFGDLATDGSYHCLLHPKIVKQSVISSA